MAQNYINKIKVSNTEHLIEPTLYVVPTLSNSAYSASLDNFALITGATIQAKFAATNPANATLNINSTGAKNIFYNNANITASQFKANHVYTLVYDGTQWQVVGDIDTNTWRGIQDNLTSSTNTTESLSAKQGYLLANGSARDDTKLPLAGGTMTGGINLVGNQSSAYNDKGLIFTKGSRIGENTDGGLGIYAAERIYLRPDSPTSSSGDGIEISGNGIIPSNNNTETLGDSSHKWSNIYATNLHGNLSVTVHTNTTNGNKNYYPWFSTATSGNLGARAHAGIYIYETVASNKITQLDFCMGSSSITGSLTLWDGTNHWGNIKPTNLSTNRNYILPNQTGTFALLTQTDANALINLLDTGSSDLTANDYVITQYVGGGTTTKTYHRRPASKVVNATLVKAALGTDTSTTTQWLNKKGLWSTPTAADIGAITKLSSSTDNAIVRFDGTSGAIQNSGVTIDDNDHLVAPSIRIANTYYGISFGRTTNTPVETILHTGIKWVSGRHMPVIHITGYAYGLNSPVEFKIGFYIYGDKIGYCGATNMGSWEPDIYLFKEARDGTNYVAVGLAGSCYFLQLSVDLQDEMGKFNNVISTDWSWDFLTTAGTIPSVDDGTTCVKVSYKASIFGAKHASITTTSNAIAYYTNTTGTFGSKASADGALYATSANGALNWGTLPVGQGGTGTTSFTANSVIISGSTTTSALTTRSIKNMTSAGNLGWTSNSTDNTILTTNTLAYWNGRYNSTTSNLAYCKKGEFGTIITNNFPTSNTTTTYLRGDGSWVSLSDMGLSTAMHYKGTVEAAPTTTAPTGTFIAGDVVVYSNSEYVYDGENWRELGSESSFKIVQTAVGDPSVPASGTTTATAFIDTITQNTNGDITATKKNLPTASTSVAGIIKIGTGSSNAMAGNTTVTNVAISANVTTNANYPVVFATSNKDTTAAKNEGLQKSGAKFYFNPNSGTLYTTVLDSSVLKLHQGTAVNPSTSSNARIEFDYSGGQPVVISYTPNDSYRAPAGLKIMGGASATPAWLEVEGNVYAAAFKGNADSATVLTSNAGGTEQPIYFSGGKPVATTYSLAASISNGTTNFLTKYTGAHAIGNSSIYNVPTIGYNTITPDYTSGGEQFYKAWLVYVSKNYANADLHMGLISPNAKGPILGNIYNVTDRDSNTELPRYSTFLFHNLSGSLESFGTYNYNYYHRTYLTDNNYTSYTYTLDGSNTGTKLQISTQSAAYTNGIQFMNSTTKKGSIGTDNNGTIGIYGTKVVLRPQLDASTKGVEVTTTAMYPTDSMTLGTTSNKWSTVYATTFSGNATSANYINLYEARGTTTTLNKAANYVAAGAMFHLIASSNTSATDNGKTPTDANILQMNWDNSGGYDAQLGIATGVNRMYFRARPSSKTAWDEVAHAPVGTAGIGNSTQPVYMTSEGVITACTSYANASVNYATSAGSATTATSLTNFVVSTYTIAAGKGVRIKYPSYAPVLISCQRSNYRGRLVLIGGGYGEEGTSRNDFTELVSPSESNFTWSMPQTTGYACTIEIINHYTNGSATVWVESTAACTFTEITALTTAATNRTLLHSSNYTDYTVTKTGTGASGSWGISVTGSSASCTGNAATATAIQTAGTTAQFYRGDNSWSDTISGGTLKITNKSNTVTIGSQNANFTHIYNSATIPFIFNNTVLTTSGNLGSTTYPFNNLYIGAKGSKGIYYVGTNSTNQMITFLDNTSDTYGNGIKIGGGGTVVIGAGESTANLSVTAGTETLYLTSDGAINIEAGGDTITNRVGIQVTAAGHVIPVKAEAAHNNAQDLGSSSAKWANIYGTTFSHTHIAGGSDGFKVLYGSTIDFFLGVGTANENHGLYDNKANKWILSAGAANTWTFVGNVTGNVSGSSGSCTGNAATASKISAKLATTTKTYLLGTSTAITGTAANVEMTGDTGVYLTTTAGQLNATTYLVNEKVRMEYNSTDQSLDFIFI